MYTELKDLQKAQDYYSKSLEILENLRKGNICSNIHIRLAHIYNASGVISMALQKYDRAETEFKKYFELIDRQY